MYHSKDEVQRKKEKSPKPVTSKEKDNSDFFHKTKSKCSPFKNSKAQDEQSRLTDNEEKLNLNQSMSTSNHESPSTIRTKKDLLIYTRSKIRKQKTVKKKPKFRYKPNFFSSPPEHFKNELTSSLHIKLTLRKIIVGEHYCDFALSHVNTSQIEILPRIYQFFFIFKTLILCTPILVFQSMPFVQTLSMAIIEISFILLITYMRVKKGVPNSGFYFWVTVLESFFILNYMIFAILKLHHPDDKKMSKSLQYYELIVLLLLFTIIIYQIVKIITQVIYYILQWMKSKKAKIRAE